MTVTIVTTTKHVTIIPSTTQSETPSMGVGVAGSNQTVILQPD